MTLIASSVMATGCMDSVEPEPTSDSAKEVIINQSGAAALPMQGEVQLVRSNNGDALSIAGAGWTETAPGIWKNPALGAASIIVGVEGHRSAIEQDEKDLAALYDRVALQADGAVADAIQQKEAHRDNLKEAAQAMAAMPGTASAALSCNIGFLNGPSSPYTGYFGALGGLQVSCSGGCQTFTVAAQACTNFGCTPVVSGSNTVCSTPWLFGVARSGSYGASCYGAASITPPGITGSRSFPCG